MTPVWFKKNFIILRIVYYADTQLSNTNQYAFERSTLKDPGLIGLQTQ